MNNSLTKIHIDFYRMDEIYETYSKNQLKYTSFGIDLDSKIILSQVLYTRKKIISCPYSLYVDYNSFDFKRIKIIIYLIELAIEKYQLGLRRRTLYHYIKDTITFIDYCDKSNIKFLEDIDLAKNAYIQYTYDLKTKLRQSKLSNKTAHTLQIRAKSILKHIHNDRENYISSFVNTISSTSSTKTIKVSPINEQKVHFNFFLKLFTEIHAFLLNKKKYPYEISLNNCSTWILPSWKRACLVTNNEKSIKAFNYEDGKARTANEIKIAFNYKSMSTPNLLFNSFKESIEKNNENFNSDCRLFLGTIGLKAFYMVFLTITGMNDSTASKLKWNEQYKVKSNSHKFKAIKYRARNKYVEFEIRKKYVKYFEMFIELRKFILNGNEIDYLFFLGFGEKAKNPYLMKNGLFSSYISKLIGKSFGNKIPQINSKQLRINKINKIIKSDGLISASQVSQTNITTLLSNYVTESVNDSEKQLTTYFNKLLEKIFEVSENHHNINVGHCKSNKVKITENCIPKEECLFCENYRIHADIEDLNKLLSLKYVIYEFKYIENNLIKFDEKYKDILQRINDLIQTGLDLNFFTKEQISEIEEDVFDKENLHPYWENKLKLFYKLGVLK